ncbi:DNA topoisomerase III [Opitutales bacterium ASA1]|uniref:type IA DNA topoisomerase n=1 Tax=Congregicoccus parvus TaxID=3081749 RepID=UPI002B2BB8D3|nr:DNA topoisomerase III [Opitutales bacterium ASA1]
MKTLIIAEKPSVAADLARALGKVPRKDDHFENDEVIISSAVGHLVELQMPEDYDKRYKFWRLDDLPIVPENFSLKPIEKSKKRFDEVKRLLKRKDVSLVVNACDAGREGELIFTYLYQLAGGKQPVKRMWMSSMTPDSIRASFKEMRTGDDMRTLADAARCRSEADWVVGINCTRGATKRLFGSRAGNVAGVGRVQTPTLAIVMEREKQIRNFVPRTFWRVVGKFHVHAGDYEGVYQRDDYKKGTDEHDRIDRLWDRARAEQIAAALANGTAAVVSEEKKRTTQIAPRLYDLTTLQREANNRYGFSADRTLRIAQALYERHKVITYPRTDSRALPEDYMPTCREVLRALKSGHGLDQHADAVLENGWVRPDKRIFNNAQVSDHFAIIPTTDLAKKLADDEAKIFDMIARRFVAAFFPVAEFDVTTRHSKVREFKFKTEGKVLVNAGWLAVYGRESTEEGGGANLPPLGTADGSPAQAKVVDHKIVEEQTKPPPRYTEATLLSAMEGAGKLVDDDELAEAMKEKGLGTPATRAAIIEKLIAEQYLVRDRRDLVPTPKAETLLDFLAVVGAEVLTKPALTGEWEFKLRKMEHGTLDRGAFMQEIVGVTRTIVDRMKTFSAKDEGRELDWKSPTDGRPMVETHRAFESHDGKIRVYKNTAGRRMIEDEARALVEQGEIGPFDDCRSPKTGKNYTCLLRLEKDEEKDVFKVRIVLPNNTENSGPLEVVWRNEKTGEELCTGAMEYVLRKPAEGDAEPERVFRMGRVICQREVPREQVVKLVSEGKTDPIPDFISKRGRKFTAILVRSGAKIAWEFPPREKKEPKEGEKARPARKSAAKAVDLTQAQPLGAATIHGGELLETPEGYFVRKSDAAEGRVVFKMARQICSREMSPDDARKIVNEGRTDLIEDFVSKRGSKFAAFLVLSGDKKKADFEFPPR